MWHKLPHAVLVLACVCIPLSHLPSPIYMCACVCVSQIIKKKKSLSIFKNTKYYCINKQINSKLYIVSYKNIQLLSQKKNNISLSLSLSLSLIS